MKKLLLTLASVFFITAILMLGACSTSEDTTLVIDDIGPLEVQKGHTFTNIDLDTIVNDENIPDSLLIWSASSNTFDVEILEGNILEISYDARDLQGAEVFSDTILLVVSNGDIAVTKKVVYTVVFEEKLLVHLPLDTTDKDMSEYGWSVSNTGVVPVAGGPLGTGYYDFQDGAYLEIAYDEILNNPESFTLSVWAKSDVDTYQDGMIIDFGYAADDHIGISYHSPFGMVGRYNLQDVAADSTVTIEEWHHYAFTYDGETSIFYVDGVEVATRDIDQGIIAANPFRVGMQSKSVSSTRHWIGGITDVRFYNKALSSSRVAALAQ